jgi:hypothetical protein
VRGPANRSGRTRRVPPRLQDGPRSGTRNARHGLRSALAGKPQLPQLNSIGFRNSPSGFLGAGMWEPKKADASRWNQTLANQNGTGSGVRLTASFLQQG